MSQPTKTPVYFRPALTNFPPAGVTIINPVPVLRPCPPLPWNTASRNAQTSDLSTNLRYPAKAMGATLSAQACSQEGQSSHPLWKAYNSIATSSNAQTNRNNASVAGALPIFQNGSCQTDFPAVESPKATASSSRASILKSFSTKRRRKQKEKKIVTAVLQETVHRQRELIGKLISVIVKDKLKKQDKDFENILKDSEVCEVEKLLNLTDSYNNKLNLTTDKAASNRFSSSKRKRRTRTTTGEKKHLCKRLRKERKSPKQSTSSRQQSVSNNSNSVVETVSQGKNPARKSPDKIESANDKQPTEDIVTATTARVLDLMHPDGDSRLFSLRVEFTRQLKSLEEDFRKEFEETQEMEGSCEQSPADTSDETKEEEREENKDDDGVFGDSDWLPSSATSSSTLRHSTSLSSGSNGDSFSMAKKFPTRKHVRCCKARCHHKKRFSRKKSNTSSSSKSVTPRQASGMALQKIDQMLRHSESGDAAKHQAENFFERTLYKIRQSIALWRKMSYEMSSFLLTDKRENTQDKKMHVAQDELESRHGNDEPRSSSHHTECNDNIVCVAHKFENEDPQDSAPAPLPDNKTDPAFMLSKFLEFLPEHQEFTDSVHGEDVATRHHQGPSSPQENEKEKEDDSEILGCKVSKAGSLGDPAKATSSASDIFKGQDTNCHDDVEKESSNHSAPFLCQFDYSEMNDPDIIGEVIVVATDVNVSPLNIHEALEEKEEKIKQENLLPDSPQELFTDRNEVALDHQDLFEDLPPPTATSPPSSGLRLEQFDTKSDSDEDELPKFELPSKKAGINQPLVQMFRPLNPECKDTDVKDSVSAPPIVVTNVTSLTENAPPNGFEYGSGFDNPLDHDHLDLKNKTEIKIKMEPDEKNENVGLFKSVSPPAVPGEDEKCLARPLKKLLTDIKLSGSESNDASVVEWGLIPRRAMHLAKQRIQEQLCGGESATADEKQKISRRFTLRSHSVLGGGDGGTDEGTKKIERRRQLTKLLAPANNAVDSLKSDRLKHDATDNDLSILRTSSNSD